MSETITKPTWILAGETGDEDVNVTPLKGKRRPGSGGDGPFVINIYLDGHKIDTFLRNRMNENQGIFK